MKHLFIFIILYTVLFILQLLGIIFYTNSNDCTFIENVNILFNQIVIAVMIIHAFLTIPFLIKIYDPIIKPWLFINIVFGMIYNAIGISILILDDSTVCQNTGIGLILCGCIQSISCAVFLVILIIQRHNNNNNEESVDIKDKELLNIINNPAANFRRNSVIRDDQCSLIAINTK